MTSLESLTVGLVLGLASALVLTSGLAVLRARTDVRVDWVPVLWALYIFVSQMQHWWAFFRLSRLETIPAPVFGLMLLRPVLLFVAGGLVLPPTPIGSGATCASTLRRTGAGACSPTPHIGW
jgi:hypothetical protein